MRRRTWWRRGAKWCPRTYSETPKDLSVWPNCWPFALSVVYFFSFHLLPLPLSGCLPSSLLLIFHLSVCSHVWLSVWTFLSDIWGGHKAEEVPNDALGLTLISEATRMCLSLWTVYCWSSTQKAGSHFWPMQNFAKNDCSPMLVQNENKSSVSLSKNVGVEPAAGIWPPHSVVC